MTDGHSDNHTQPFDFNPGRSGSGAGERREREPDLDIDLDDDLWEELGARRGPRQPAEGVRIIGAEEAAAAIESGQVARKMPDDAPRFGDVPQPPAGPRPPFRFPGDDPMAVSKPPVSSPPPRNIWDEPEGEDLFATAPRAADRGREYGREPGYGRGYDDDLFASAGRGGEPEPEPAPPVTRAGTDPWDEEPADPAYDEPATPSGLPHWTEPPSGEVPRILPGEDPPSDDLSAWSSLSARPRWRDQPSDWADADFDETILGDEDHRLGALESHREETPFSFDEPEPEPEPLPPEQPTPVRSGLRSRPPTRQVGSVPGGPPPRPPGAPSAEGHDVSTRVVTGAIAGGVVLLAAIIGPGALTFLIGAVLVLAAAELYQALRTRGYHPATLLGLVGTASMVGGVYWRGEVAFPLVLALFVVFTLLWYLTGVVRARPAMNVAVTVMAFLYVGFLGSFAALILTAGDAGIGVLLGAILATVANDVGAFFVGRWAGRTPLAPAISPKKTVEGLIGAAFATLAVCLIIVRFIDPWDGGRAFWLFVVVSVAAPLGDLCESMIKRDLGIKDMGTLLPGHGGVLDRIDTLLFVIPSTYYMLLLLA
jgi:phosphatidate cytidylyltransferase